MGFPSIADEPQELDRPGRVEWIQFESITDYVYLIKTNSDDQSMSLIQYRETENVAHKASTPMDNQPWLIFLKTETKVILKIRF